jgi:hypothetical protein
MASFESKEFHIVKQAAQWKLLMTAKMMHEHLLSGNIPL